jgi:hypothetical protein
MEGNPVNYPVKIAVLVTIIGSVSACTPAAESIQPRIDQVNIGSTRASAIAQVGPPTATNTSNFLGAEKVTLVWRERATVCAIDFIFDHAYAKACRSFPI